MQVTSLVGRLTVHLLAKYSTCLSESPQFILIAFNLSSPPASLTPDFSLVEHVQLVNGAVASWLLSAIWKEPSCVLRRRAQRLWTLWGMMGPVTSKLLTSTSEDLLDCCFRVPDFSWEKTEKKLYFSASTLQKHFENFAFLLNALLKFKAAPQKFRMK